MHLFKDMFSNMVYEDFILIYNIYYLSSMYISIHNVFLDIQNKLSDKYLLILRQGIMDLYSSAIWL